ncbi:hypothetical protein PQO01_10370 [Lentisphaera marina]|uniref:hypothetical protein n=1 Tax=Lentisphaera marina TaxID=1111041 RepID=UPI0023665A8C|nr:hypothetical protein [Lentisphaera marina]MDD7985357.1 hypothetical protein [Lentisphaera marina]
MNPIKKMTRTNKTNLNHHMWNNNGVWFMQYTIYPTPVTKQRIRRSLHTHSVIEARKLRDEILGGYLADLKQSCNL